MFIHWKAMALFDCVALTKLRINIRQDQLGPREIDTYNILSAETTISTYVVQPSLAHSSVHSKINANHATLGHIGVFIVPHMLYISRTYAT